MSTQDMPEPQAVAGAPARVLIVRAPYYRAIVDGMTAGAQRLLARAGAEVAIEDVAGAFELPQAIRIILNGAARGGPRWDGFIALGCVVRGDTDHYDHICREAHRGLMDVALTYGIALGTGDFLKDGWDAPGADPTDPFTDRAWAFMGAGTLLGLLFRLWNEGYLQGKRGQSIGKKVLKIGVINERTGQYLGVGRGLGRLAVDILISLPSQLIPLLFFIPLVNYLWPLWDDKNQTWHDKAVHSLVVRTA